MDKKAYRKQWCENRRLQGLCVRCGDPSYGKHDCDKCRENDKLLRAERKANGLCFTCGKPSVFGKKECQKCLDRQKLKMSKRRELHRTTNSCVTCGKPLDTVFTVCKVCLEAQRQHRHKKRSERRAQGICEDCGRNPSVASSDRKVGSLCEICYLKDTARTHFVSCKRWTELQDLFDKQSICPYTGIPLKLGVNTSLDHIIPKCHGGGEDIENLQWIYKSGSVDINLMKGGMTDKLFRKVVSHIFKTIQPNGQVILEQGDNDATSCHGI